MAARFDPRMHAYEEQTRQSGVLYVLMLVVAVAFGGFLWQLYSTPEAPTISPPPGPYKISPESGASVAAAIPAHDSGETEALTVAEAAPEDAAAEAVDEPRGAPTLAPAPMFVANGPYVAQVAALQSEAAVEQAWRRLSSRAPSLFAQARLDVQRADLGQRGVYYRVRAGYFADRANAARFCERIRQMGQDCIATAR